MSGALTALAALGAQNAYLSISPEVTFWKALYKRVTNFAIEPYALPAVGTAQPGRNVTFKVARTGDLINQQYLEVNLPAYRDGKKDGDAEDKINYAVDNLGYAMIETVTVKIGGQQFDQWTGTMLDMYHNLSHKPGKRDSYNLGSGRGLHMEGRSADETAFQAGKLMIPLCFWYNMNASQSLPVIALQFHEIEISVQFKKAVDFTTNVVSASGISPATTTVADTDIPDMQAKLWTNYVYLDTSERKLFAQSPHEVLIKQVQYQGSQSGKNSQFDLNFNHPCLELLWVFQDSSNPKAISTLEEIDTEFKTQPGIGHFFDTATLTLNGHNRFPEMDAKYFNQTVPLECHTRQPDKAIYVWSSALEPENWRPSGSLNMSRIDSVKLKFKSTQPTQVGYTGTGTPPSGAGPCPEIQIYATNFNTVKVVSGMAGLRFSN